MSVESWQDLDFAVEVRSLVIKAINFVATIRKMPSFNIYDQPKKYVNITDF